MAIPDPPGNRRADTFTNLLQNPRVGLFFLIPGKRETLRVSGTGIIVRDESLRATMAIKGKSPDFAVVVNIEEAFFHCTKCIIRSQLWQSDDWPDLDDLPSLAEAMVDAGKLELSVAEMQTIIDNDEKERLY